MSRKRTVVRTRFEAFLHWAARDSDEPTAAELENARRRYDAYGCAEWDMDTFLRMLMFR